MQTLPQLVLGHQFLDPATVSKEGLTNMKRIVLLVFLSVAACVCALARSTGTWSSFVYNWADYSPNLPSNTFVAQINAFTPDTAIIVTRIEMDAVQGSTTFDGTQFVACPTNASVALQGAKTAYTLSMAPPQGLPSPPAGPLDLHSYTDSGPLHLSVAAGSRLSLDANQADPNCTIPTKVQIVVQYHAVEEDQQ
jgi:hypothetical protein